MERQKVCGVCRRQFAEYRCPKCGLPYCSLECYRGEGHVECSEHFYKDQVVSSLEEQRASAEDREKMREILSRIRENQPNLESFLSLEGGTHDEEDKQQQQQQEEQHGLTHVSSNGAIVEHGAEGNSAAVEKGEAEADALDSLRELAQAIDDLDLDDPVVCEQVWQTLTPQQRVLFQEQLQSGLLAADLDVWEPWWLHVPETLQSFQLIQDATTQLLDVAVVPSIPKTLRQLSRDTNLQPMAEVLRGRSPAPEVVFNMLNVLLAYAYSLRLYNGDAETHGPDMVAAMLQASVVLSQPTAVCNSAAEAVTHLSLQLQAPSPRATAMEGGLQDAGDSLEARAKEHARVVSLSCEDVGYILRHPCTILAALLHALSLLSAVAARKGQGAKALAKQAKRGQRKLWFLCCWWNEVVQNIEQGKGLAYVKDTLASLSDAVQRAAEEHADGFAVGSTSSKAQSGDGAGLGPKPGARNGGSDHVPVGPGTTATDGSELPPSVQATLSSATENATRSTDTPSRRAASSQTNRKPLIQEL